MLRFPVHNLLAPLACYDWLLTTLWPEGLRCPAGHTLPPAQAPHDRKRAPLLDFRCRACGKVFNLWTRTVWQGTRYDVGTIVAFLRGVAQGTPTLQLADELGRDYSTLLKRRHALQAAALAQAPTRPLGDAETEADEMFQNAGEKGDKHDDPDDPPRRRANNRPGLGTAANDRPPIQGVVGRTSGQLRLTVCPNTQQATIEPEVEAKTLPATVLHTDESAAYHHVRESGRGHKTVCHSRREYARDDDGDGFCEVHCNTLEGIWTGLRNFLRPFRGVHKKYLAQYVAMFEWAHNLKQATAEFLRALMLPSFTFSPT